MKVGGICTSKKPRDKEEGAEYKSTACKQNLKIISPTSNPFML